MRNFLLVVTTTQQELLVIAQQGFLHSIQARKPRRQAQQGLQL